ncbi:copper amine oxidase N-terminal domain-containing protein [Heliomicrobium undosum]|nr:copper amine oxidase N-terminal domain-containing protein [Heliomicrobium undosum]
MKSLFRCTAAFCMVIFAVSISFFTPSFLSPGWASTNYSAFYNDSVTPGSSFDQRIDIEIPKGYLNLGSMDSLNIRLGSGISVNEVIYSIPEKIQEEQNMFIENTGVITPQNGEYVLKVSGRGVLHKGHIVLRFKGVKVGGGTRDVKIYFDAPGGSVFESKAINFISTASNDYNLDSQYGTVEGLSGSNEMALTFREIDAGTIKRGSDSIRLKLSSPFVWDITNAKVDISSGDITLRKPVIDDEDPKALLMGIERLSSKASTFRITGIFVRDMSKEVTTPSYYNMSVGGYSKANIESKSFLYRPDPLPLPEPPVALFSVGNRQCKISGLIRNMDVAPFIREDRIFLPVRYLAEALKVPPKNITWNVTDEQTTVALEVDGHSLKLNVGDRQIEDSRRGKVMMDVAPVILDSRVFLPARWIAEPLGYSVGWDASKQEVTINKGTSR